MPVSKIGTNALASGLDVSSTNISYTGTLTGGTGVINIGSGQVYKDASGNLGIGTSSPSYKLQVNNASASATADAVTVQNSGVNVVGDAAGIRFRFSAAEPAAIRAILTNTSNGAGALGLFTSSDGTGANITERARIDSSGNLLVGTTTSSLYNQNTASGLSVLPGTSANLQISTDPAGSAGNACALLNMRNTPINGAKYVRFFYNGTTETGSISLNGTTSVAYNTSSDYRLKHDIQPMTGALARVSALKPVTYKWNADGSDGEGFIAHELAEICPQAVNGEKDAVDAEGNPVYQGIDTSFLVATLTAAIQELKAELDSVKAELAALKGA